MLNLTYYKEKEKANAETLNRPLKEISNFFKDSDDSGFLTHGDCATKDEIEKGEDDNKIYYWDDFIAKFSGSGLYIGKIEAHALAEDELKPGWIPCDGKLYDSTSIQGRALSTLPYNCKYDFDIFITNNKVNAPKIASNVVFISDEIPGVYSSKFKSGGNKGVGMTYAIYVGISLRPESEVTPFPDPNDKKKYFGWKDDPTALGFGIGKFYRLDK